MGAVGVARPGGRPRLQAEQQEPLEGAGRVAPSGRRGWAAGARGSRKFQRLQAEGREEHSLRPRDGGEEDRTELLCSCRGEAGSMADGAAVYACGVRVCLCEQAHRRSCF